jgi:dihydrodipicolinate synthase/N-acetylneuraminate lyase
MVSAQDLSGVMGMMPAFATPDGADIDATSTIDLDNLRDGVNRMIGDGIDVIATTGSFGEFHTLLWPEFETLARATAEIVNKRVPLFIGCTALNSREAVQRMRIAQEVGAYGVLVGVPFYFPSTVDNAVRFYHDISERFPDLGIMIYHNPALHNVTIPVDAFHRITQSPNVVAMKDSHRSADEFSELQGIVRGKMTVFVNQMQIAEYSQRGATSLWSIDAWMGPWPLLALRDAVRAGDLETAKRITAEIIGPRGGDGARPSGPPNLSWRETANKIAQGFAGYVNPGPLRPPFVELPADVVENAKKRAAYWNELCARYRSEVKTPAAV